MVIRCYLSPPPAPEEAPPNKFIVIFPALFIFMMDLTEPYQAALQDFFEQSRINHLILPIQNETQKYYDEEQIFKFQNDRTDPPLRPCPSAEEERGSEAHIEQLLKAESSQDELLGHLQAGPQAEGIVKVEERETYFENEANIQTRDLESIISFLVQHPHSSTPHLTDALLHAFPAHARLTLVRVLVEKFARLKKTKEELIKYCMRKAFKFILELPKNQHILDGDKREKYSFSKCKNKYLKRVSEEKSMNNKFLQQIFSEGDFRRDYLTFLEHFDGIMSEDNHKKIAYLAELLTNKEGKVRSVEMVKRLPWTKAILDKVHKISRELLKFAEEGQR